MKMKENETINEFSFRFMELVNQMKSYGEKLVIKESLRNFLSDYLINMTQWWLWLKKQKIPHYSVYKS